MAFMLKVRWNIAAGKRATFEENQRALCAVMLEHPGVICYHATYPDEETSEWIEIYANDAAFRAHLDNDKGKAPLAAVSGACTSIDCRCFGDPDTASRAILKGFGTTYEATAPEAFVLHPRADRDSPV
jgi:quinol monooxygenase YgiN